MIGLEHSYYDKRWTSSVKVDLTPNYDWFSDSSPNEDLIIISQIMIA